MTPEKQIFWHQGLFLQPQHFQQAERYQQSLLTPVNQYRQPYCWGLRSIAINESALANRTVELTGLEAVFQDFSWVMAGENCSVPTRSFADLEEAFSDGDSLTVYIGLKQWNRFAANVTDAGNSDATVDTRYTSLEDPVEQKDLYDQGPPAAIRYLNHHLKLFWQSETETAGDYHLLPILRLEMHGETIVRDTTYVPPTLTLESSSFLLQIVKNIHEQMQARCRILETYKPVHGREINSLETAALYYLFALNSLNRYVALLQHYLEQPLIHPWQLYGILRQLVGELSTFSDRMNGLGQLRDGQVLLAGYTHIDTGRCFAEIQQLIAELLEAIVIGSENILIMDREGDRFHCEVPPELLRGRHLYCLMVRTGQEKKDVINTFLHHVKTGSCRSVDTLITRSLAGVNLIFQEIPPLGIVRREGYYCFEMNTESSQWQQIEKDKTLCLHWDQAPEDAAMELVATRL